MKRSVVKTVPAFRPLALACALATLFSTPVLAQSSDVKTLAPVIVSASRFASDPAQVPIGATVITAEEIREAGIVDVNEAVRRLGGVYGRLNLSGTQDYPLDLRGFGVTSDQNLVVLVDGIRLSESESTTALLSSVPIDSVERIEIVRGGSSVLYGEGATGGVIQIITKRGVQRGTSGSASATVGSFGYRELRGGIEHGWNDMSVSANASEVRADNFRDNADTRQKNVSGMLQWAAAGSRVGLRVEAARLDSRFAGPLSLAQFQQNPRQASTPNDFGSFDTDRYTLFGEHRIGQVDVAAELSRRERRTASSMQFFGQPSNLIQDSTTTQFSPRLRYRTQGGGVAHELVGGLDFTRWTRHGTGAWGGFPWRDEQAKQSARAVYVRDEVRVGAARVAAGIRREVFDKDYLDPTGGTAYQGSHGLTAWDVQAKYTVSSALSVFGKAGRSYRVANADDNSLTPVASQPLEPQISHDLEMGLTAGGEAANVTVRLFQHLLRNEIAFDPTVGFGANVNLDPTRRRGIEVEGTTRLMKAFQLSATLQHISAKFRDGPNAGNEMVLVPRNTANVRLHWLPGGAHSAFAGVQWASSQRYGDDFTNACTARIPSFTTIDARYAYRHGGWEFAVSGANLADKRYFTNATGNPCPGGIYPDPGRQLKFSARYDF